MSFDYGVWYEPEPITDMEAAEKYERLLSGDIGWATRHDGIATFYAELTSGHLPEVENLRDPYSRYWQQRPAYSDVCILYGHLGFWGGPPPSPEERLANRCDLVHYDRQFETVRLPTRLFGTCVFEIAVPYVRRRELRRVYNSDPASFEEAVREAVNLGQTFDMRRRDRAESLCFTVDDDYGQMIRLCEPGADEPKLLWFTDKDDVVAVCLAYGRGDSETIAGYGF